MPACRFLFWTLLLCVVALPASADWRQSRGDQRCSGSSPEITAPKSGTARTWTFNGSGRVWGYKPGMTVWSSPAIAAVNGRALLAVGSYDSKLYCLDATTGTEAWTFTAGAPISATSAIWKEGEQVRLFVAADDRLVYALDADKGRQLWVHSVQDYRPTLGGARLGSPAVGKSGKRTALFVSYWVWDNSLGHSMQQGGLTALDAHDGRPIWSKKLGDNQMTAPLYVRRGSSGDDVVFVGSHNGVLYALATTDGEVLWQHRELDAIRSPPAYVSSKSNPLIIVASKYGSIRGLRAADGVERWKYKTGDRITGSPAVYDWDGSKTVVVGSYDRHLYALDANTGELKWRYLARGGIYSSPALAIEREEPLILVSAWDHALHAVSPRDGSRVFSRFTGRPLWEVTGLDDSNWSSPLVAQINDVWMVFTGSYDGTFRGFVLEESAGILSQRRSNLAFWVSFPIVLTIVTLISLLITLRYRQRHRNSYRV